MRATFLLLTTLATLAHAQVRLDLGGGQSLDLIRVEPGTFTQGSPATEVGRAADESQRGVTITRPFLIGKFPVTRGQFARFATASGYRTEAERGTSGGFGWVDGKLVQRRDFTWRNPGFPQTDEHPVVIVDFKDAEAFCAWLSRQTGRRFALPSEAQWEFAARAGTTDAWHGASADAVAWHRGNSPGGTQPVGKKSPNPWGIHDMPGNAWEWCADWMAPYAPGDVTDPLQTNSALSDKPRRVLRGGAFSRPADETRVAKRFRNDPGSRNADNGFRVITLDVAAPSAPAPPPPQPAPQPILERSEPPPPIPASSGVERVPHEAWQREESSSSSSGFMWVLIAGIGAFVIYFVRKLLRTTNSYVGAIPSPAPPRPSTPGAPLQVRTGRDGFWVTGNIPRGTTLRARWMAGGSQQDREFSYQPGPEGQFIFTGGQPISVSVNVVESTHDTTTGVMTGAMLDDDLPRTPPPARPTTFRGHPPAY